MRAALCVLFFFFAAQGELCAKIRLLTFHYNRPDFVELQCRTFAKFMQEEYELIVFNDGDTPEREEGIRSMCEKYGIRCVRYEQRWHWGHLLSQKVRAMTADPTFGGVVGSWTGNLDQHPSLRHCHVIQYALDLFGYGHDDVVVIVDGDFFPIRPFSLRELMQGYDVIGLQRPTDENAVFPWVVFIALQMPQLPDKDDVRFEVDLINGYIHDSGAHSYHYLARHPQVLWKLYPSIRSSRSWVGWDPVFLRQSGFSQEEIDLSNALTQASAVEFHIDHRFLHYGASSFADPRQEEKSRCVKQFFDRILEKF